MKKQDFIAEKEKLLAIDKKRRMINIALIIGWTIFIALVIQLKGHGLISYSLMVLMVLSMTIYRYITVQKLIKTPLNCSSCKAPLMLMDTEAIVLNGRCELCGNFAFDRN